MFGSAPDQIIGILTNENVTPNSHSFCLTKQVSAMCIICVFVHQLIVFSMMDFCHCLKLETCGFTIDRTVENSVVESRRQ